MHRVHWFTNLVSLVAVTLVAACGGGGGGGGNQTLSPPVISNLTFAPSSLPQGTGSGMAAVDGTLNFTDSGGDLASLQITVLDQSGTQVASTSSPLQGVSGQTSGQIQGQIEVSTDTPGIFTFRITATDAQGSKSNELSGNFQVVAVSSQAAVVATTGAGPHSLTAISGTLYWSEAGENALLSAPATGGPVTVLATKMVNPVSLAFAGSDVVWLDDRGVAPGLCDANSVNRVLKRTAANGTTQVLASGPACGGGAGDVVLLGTNAYWVSSPSSSTWSINSTPLDGSATTIVRTSTTPIGAIAANGGVLYWMESFFPATPATIYGTVPGSGSLTTVASGFTADVNAFAIDNSAVYYLATNFPYPSTEALWAQPLAGGSPVQLAAAIPAPIKLLSTANLSGNSLVWIDASSVNATPTTGGAITQLATATGTPIDLLFDGANVLWSEATNAGQHGETGAVRSVALTGGSVTTLHQGGDAPRQLARDPSARLNWTEGGSVGTTEGFARIARIGLTGQEETVLTGVTNDSVTLASTSSSLLFADGWRIKSLPLAGGMPTTVAAGSGGLIGGLTSDGTSVYWDDITSEINRAPVGGGPITVLVAQGATGNGGPGGPIRIGPDGNLYWATTAPNPASPAPSVLSAPSAAPSSSVTLVAANLPGLSDLAVDASGVYIAQSSPGADQILRLPLGGGSSTTLATTFPGLTQLALDGANLYWLDQGGIFSVPTAGGPATEAVQFDGGTPTTFALDPGSVYFADSQLLDIRKVAR